MSLKSPEQFNIANKAEGQASVELDSDFIATFSKVEDRRCFEVFLDMEERENKEERKERMARLFDREVASREINDLFVFPDRKIDSRTLVASGHKHGIETVAILFTDQEGKREICGEMDFSFYEDEGKKILYIDAQELKEQKTGLGLEIECRLEKFCRDNSISTIYTRATSSSDKKFIGAYVHALHGYEFEWPGESSSLQSELNEYLAKRGIKIDTEIESLQRPIDFAVLKGRNREGRIVEVGKEFLTASNLNWEGRRDLAFDSPGTQDFIRYLEGKGRNDLIEKYF